MTEFRQPVPPTLDRHPQVNRLSSAAGHLFGHENENENNNNARAITITLTITTTTTTTTN